MFGKTKKLKKQPEEVLDVLTPNVLTIPELFAPDGILEGINELALSNNTVRLYALHGVPRRLQVGWLDEILTIGGVDVSVHYQPAKDIEVLRTLLSKITKARSQLYLDRQSGNIARLPQLEAEIADYDALYASVQLGEDRLYYLTFIIAVHAVDEQVLAKKCEVIETKFARQGVKPVITTLRQIQALKSTLPLGLNSQSEYAKNFTTGAAMTAFPITTAAGGHSTGVMLGENLFTRAPVFLHRFGGERLVSNPHLFISGVSGAGKSVTLRQITLLEAYAGIKGAFVDVEGEYAYFVQELGGEVITLRPGEFSGLNPLEVEPEIGEGGKAKVNVAEKIEDILGLVGTVYEFYTQQGLGVLEASLLESAILAEYDARGINQSPDSLYNNQLKKSMPTLSDIAKRLSQNSSGKKLAESMRPLLTGGTVGMFDGQTTINLEDATHICFNLKPLGGDFSRFVGTYATLSWLWGNFAQKGGKQVPKTIAVDEAWMFLKHKSSAKYLEILARRGRKHGCGLIIATQRFEEFAKSEEGRAVIESCATILTLKQEEHATDAVVNYFRLAPGCGPLLTDANPGQGILRVSGDTVAVQISPAPFEWALVETKIHG